MPWWAGHGLIRQVAALRCCIAIAIAIAQIWTLLAGCAGLVSVGQQAFMGVAATKMVVMAQLWSVNPHLVVPSA